jgi:hypothetical protein
MRSSATFPATSSRPSSRAFNEDFRGIPLTGALHGVRFRIPFLDVPQTEATQQPVSAWPEPVGAMPARRRERHAQA